MRCFCAWVTPYCASFGAVVIKCHFAQLGLGKLECALGLGKYYGFTHGSTPRRAEKNVMPIVLTSRYRQGSETFVVLLKKHAFFADTSLYRVYVATCATQERVSGADLQKFQNSEAAFNTRECRVERKVEGNTIKNNTQMQHTHIERGIGVVVAGRRNRDKTSVGLQSPMRKNDQHMNARLTRGAVVFLFPA